MHKSIKIDWTEPVKNMHVWRCAQKKLVLATRPICGI